MANLTETHPMTHTIRRGPWTARFTYPVLQVTGPGLFRPAEYLARFPGDEGFEPIGKQLHEAIRYTRRWAPPTAA